MPIDVDSWRERITRADAGALYVHVPFCARKCAYCDFASWATDVRDPVMKRYLAAIQTQLSEASDLGLTEKCETAYVGGGTPTLLQESLGDLVSRMRSVAPYMSELTSEANPDSLSDGVISALASSGATRLSVGVQSLDDRELAELGRLHDSSSARERVSEALRAGLDVSVDLMCAIPLQTALSWRETLEGILALGVCHVSVYPLAIEEGTPLALRIGDSDPDWNDPDVQADRMSVAEEVIQHAGLSRYEVASYAKPGHSCRHNIAYWTGIPYLGLGSGAASMLTIDGYEVLRRACSTLPVAPHGSARTRLTCTTPRDSLGRLADTSFDVEFLNEREAAAEDLMLGARLVSGLDPGLVKHARSVIGPRVDSTLECCLNDSLLFEEDGRLAPTRRGWLLGNELFGRLWELSG